MDSQTLLDLANIVTPILLFVVGGVLAVIAYFLKNLHEEIKTKFSEIDETINEVKTSFSGAVTKLDEKYSHEISRLERDLLEHKAQLPRLYVLKDDYIRTISVFEHKLDSMDKKSDQKFTDINKKIDAQFETLSKKIDLLTRRENGKS